MEVTKLRPSPWQNCRVGNLACPWEPHAFVLRLLHFSTGVQIASGTGSHIKHNHFCFASLEPFPKPNHQWKLDMKLIPWSQILNSGAWEWVGKCFSLPVLQFSNLRHILHASSEGPRGIELQLLWVVIGSLAHPLLASCHSLSYCPHYLITTSWDQIQMNYSYPRLYFRLCFWENLTYKTGSVSWGSHCLLYSL